MNPTVLNHIDNIVVNHKEFSDGLDTLNFNLTLKKNGYANPIGIALLGESGMGKTTLINKFIAQHPKVETDTQTFTPIAVVTVPAKPQGRSLCDAILDGLGYKPISNRENTHIKVKKIVSLLQRCCTNALVLDEMQHFSNRFSGKDAHEAADTLKIILDSSKVMLVCSGLEYGASLFEQNEQLKRRFSQSIKLSRFVWSDSDSRAQFKGFLRAIQKTMEPHFKTIDLFENEMAFRLFIASGGITGYVKEIISGAALNSLYRKQEQLGLSDYADAYSKTEFALSSQGGGSNPFNRSVNLANLSGLLRESQMIGVAAIDKQKKQKTNLSMSETERHKK